MPHQYDPIKMLRFPANNGMSIAEITLATALYTTRQHLNWQAQRLVLFNIYAHRVIADMSCDR